MGFYLFDFINPALATLAFRQAFSCWRSMAGVVLLCFVFLSEPLSAQEPSDTVSVKEPIEIGEVTVQGHRVVNTENGQRIFPTRRQLEASATGYSLLKTLALPGISVDEVTKEIKSPDILGSVQIRINDIVATSQDLLALEMATVKSVDFIREPGLRYGKDVAYVININVVRQTSGYAIGGELTQSLTCLRGSQNVFARFNRGKSEISLDYGCGLRYSDGAIVEKTTTYTLADGTEYTAFAKDLSNPDKGIDGTMRLRYSLADEGKYQFNVTLSGAFSHAPKAKRIREMTTPVGVDNVVTNVRDRDESPQLDVYFNVNLPHKQTLTINANAAYVGSRYDYRREDVEEYAYSVRGKMRSVSGEVLYENRLKPFTLSAGLQYSRDRISNEYSGDVGNSPLMRQSEVYGYAQLRGSLGKLGWKAGMGLAQKRYTQGNESFRYTLPRPVVMLSYRFSPAFFVRYNYELSIHAPRNMFLNDVVTTDETVPLPSGVIKEMTVGNPALKPDNRNEHNLMLSFAGKKVESQLYGMYLYYRKNTIMQDITRNTLDDGTTQFLFTRRNQGSIRMMLIGDYTTLHLIAEKLDVSLYGTVSRCWNFGDDYTHTCTSLMYSAQVNAYLGRLTLSAFAGNGWSFLEGETKSKGCTTTSLSASYRFNRIFRLALHWQNPFRKDVVVNDIELLNRNLHRNLRVFGGDMGNKITLQLNVSLSRGRKFAEAERILRPRKTDAGVMKHE